MNAQERIEALLKLMAIQNQNLMVMVGSLPIWFAPAGTPTPEVAEMAKVLSKMVSDNKELMVFAMGHIAKGAEKEREANHHAQSEAEKAMEAAFIAEMTRPPIGFKVP